MAGNFPHDSDLRVLLTVRLISTRRREDAKKVWTKVAQTFRFSSVGMTAETQRSQRDRGKMESLCAGSINAVDALPSVLHAALRPPRLCGRLRRFGSAPGRE